MSRARLEQLATRSRVTAEVATITDYGAWIDLGEGVRGLVTITDLSYGRVRHPSDLLRTGQSLTFAVLGVHMDEAKVILGLKQLQPDPWASAADRFAVGTVMTGEVVSVKDYGVFVEIGQYIEGLMHMSTIAGSWPVVGDTVEVRVVALDIEARRISLTPR